MQPRSSFRPWFPLAAAGLFLAAHFAFVLVRPPDGLRITVTDAMSPAVNILAAAGMLFAARRLRPYSRRLALAWTVLAVAQGLNAGGDLLWLVFQVILRASPSPSPADILYLLYYPTFLVGVLLIPSREDSNLEWTRKGLDIFIVLLAALLILWNFILGPASQSRASDPRVSLINLAYSSGDLLLFAALLMILYRPSGLVRSLPLWLLAAGLLAVIAFDILYSYQMARGTYLSGGLLSVGYTLSNLLFGLAGYYQARRAGPDIPDQARVSERWWLTFLPYIWVVGAYVLMASSSVANLPMSRSEITTYAGILIALVLLRQTLAMWENRSLSRSLAGVLGQVRQQALALERANQEMQGEIQERRRAEERLSFDALHDSLTALPNRVLFTDRLGLAGRKKKRNPAFQYAVLFLDLDSFKVVNDSMGHNSGDLLLVKIASVLESCVRATDTVARLGGDEFAILLEELNSAEDAAFTADRLQEALSQPVLLNGTRVFITVSIGIVQHMETYDSPEDILRDADLAMYYAKARGKARYAIFHPGMRAKALSRMELESDLRRALECQEFLLHYQPILELPGQRLVGFEALVRWQHPLRGLVAPAEFIDIAEETGLIIPLGRWILFEACRQARAWEPHFAENPAVKVSVNISGRQLKQPDFVLTVAQALAETGLNASRLALEVTESICLDSLDSIAGTLEALKQLGVEILIDDFGTGYSSLSYLQRLPVQSIKIDRSFIHAITGGGNGSGPGTPDIVRAIFSMVNQLGIKAVAEGIETEVQLAELNRLHCSYVQGFLLARPMDHDHIESWMAAHA